MRRWLKDRMLAVVLAAGFVVSWVGQFFTQIAEQSSEAATHGQVFMWGDFWPAFWQSTFENWQSEFLQLLSFVVLAKFFIYVGSPQSRDGDDEMKQYLQQILANQERSDGAL